MIYAIVFAVIVICQIVFMFWKTKSDISYDIPVSSDDMIIPKTSPESAGTLKKSFLSKIISPIRSFFNKLVSSIISFVLKLISSILSFLYKYKVTSSILSFLNKDLSSIVRNPVKPRNTRFLINRNDSKIDNICFIAIGLVLLIMAATRDATGYDWLNYHYFFDRLHLLEKRYSFVERLFLLYIEPGFSLLNMIMPSFIMLLIVVAVFSVPTKLWIINKYSEAKYISLLMYFAGIFLAYDMGIMRQGIAISIALMGLPFIKEKKLFKFLLIIFAGMMFHIATIFFVPLYFLNYRKYSRKTIYIVTLIALIFYFIDLSRIIVFFVYLINNEFFIDRLSEYIEYGNTLIMSLVKRIIVLIIFVEFYEYFKINDKMSRIFLNGYVLSIAMMAVFSSVPIVSGRGAMTLYFLQIFIFAKIFAVSNKLYLKFGLFALIIALSIDTMTGIITEGNMTAQPYTPYRSLIGHYWRLHFGLYPWLN